jgi:alkaline phosphatase D
MWDNHEFSIYGWQSMQVFNGQNRPAQTRKVAANQTWFEYQPSRAAKSSGPNLEQFAPPPVQDRPIAKFDGNGLGDEPNNRVAISSLTGYRAIRWGLHVELIITDQRSYRSEEPSGRPEAKALTSEDFPELVPQEAMEILDAGRNYAGGNPPDTIRIGDKDIPNFRKNGPPQSILGAVQKKWFLERLKDSKATWKIWGNTLGTLDYRADPQNLPAGLTRPWPGLGYATFRGGDASTAYVERAEIYSLVRDHKITGFVTLAGDRHAFWAGLAASSLPPEAFEPVGVAFVTGSISAPGLAEKFEQSMTQDHPLHALYMLKRSPDAKPEATVNMLARHGVRSCLEYQRTGDVKRARHFSNPDLSPHLSFLDLGGNGYMTVRATRDAIDVEFLCIPRPVERIDHVDGGPLLYRVVHHIPMWASGQTPRLEQHVLEGNPEMAL